MHIELYHIVGLSVQQTAISSPATAHFKIPVMRLRDDLSSVCSLKW